MWGASARAHVHTSVARWCLLVRSSIAIGLDKVRDKAPYWLDNSSLWMYFKGNKCETYYLCTWHKPWGGYLIFIAIKFYFGSQKLWKHRYLNRMQLSRKETSSHRYALQHDLTKSSRDLSWGYLRSNFDIDLTQSKVGNVMLFIRYNGDKVVTLVFLYVNLLTKNNWL